jgi:hypothetical protein
LVTLCKDGDLKQGGIAFVNHEETLILYIMSTRGSKVERRSVSEQPHELKYEAKKEGTTPQKVEAAKKSAGSNQRAAVEKKIK